MPNLEPFKRTLNWLSSLFITILLTASFAYVWYNCYYTELVLPFYRKGNWMVIGIYLVIAVIFNQVYGSYKVGYLRKSEAFYSQIISVFVINLITYCQISVIGRDFMNIMPMVFLTIADLIIVLIWTLVSSALYKMFFPPRRMIIVYGSQNAGNLVLKMSQRTDKYIIAESVKADEDLDVIKEKILGYGA
ncbi:MAG: sugar transferase, partial [Oscillospiraceae bacterium]|nr:sugar transferase [Oscillospiraceae bacterium]